VAILAAIGYFGKRYLEAPPAEPEPQYVLQAGPVSSRPKLDLSAFDGVRLRKRWPRRRGDRFGDRCEEQ
jgi:hypothetical protein